MKNLSILDALSIIAPIFPAPMYWHDTKGVVLGINSECLKHMNKSIDEVLGKTPYDFYPPEIADYVWQNSEQVIEKKDVLSQEEYAYDAYGKCSRCYLAIKAPLYDESGKVIGVLGTSIDITELKNTQNELIKAKELAESANQAKTYFVQNMQHDIRTPAAGVWGVLNALAENEKDLERKKALMMATTSSKRLLDLCNDAVEFGDLDGNAKPIIEKKINPREIAKNILELNFPAAFGKDLVIRFKVDTSVPPYVILDQFRLSRILINLLGNAVKFTEKGEVSLSLSAKINTNRNKNLLFVEVKDTGIGISKEQMNFVFQKFSKGISSDTNKYSGAGLGLYIVKKFIDELDGDIEIESHERHGSCFTIIFPFKTPLVNEGELGVEINEKYISPIGKEKNESIYTIPNQEYKGERQKNIYTHRVLIIEDDDLCLFSEKKIVSLFTDSVDTAKNMSQALELLSHNQYDLIISDLGLPDGSGIDIASVVTKSSDSSNKDTPFIAMTAHRSKEKHQAALNAGFAEVATKPLTKSKTEQFLNAYPLPKAEDKVDRSKLLDMEIIDLELTMKRINVSSQDEAISTLGILANSLKKDISALQKFQEKNNILEARNVLHKIKGGLCYCGTPRLEKAIVDLHIAVKAVEDLKSIEDIFNMVYEQATLFEEQYQELAKKNSSG